jgi:3-phosphoglycerate kinase
VPRVLAPHFGRPNGNKMPEEFSLAPVAKALEGLSNKPATFLKDTVGPETEAACADPAEGSVIFLENTRFYTDEEDKGVKPDGEPPYIARFICAFLVGLYTFRRVRGRVAGTYPAPPPI